MRFVENDDFVVQLPVSFSLWNKIGMFNVLISSEISHRL